MTTYSPLRYPGGKNKLSTFFAEICLNNNINEHFIEPYSGGASVALFLLMNKLVKKITINDADRSIYAFWFSALNYTEKLCNMIGDCKITIENWGSQRAIQGDKENGDILTLGFSTLFLNRTNYSGIIKGGPIGGLNQLGDYKIDCRFNKKRIIEIISRIAEFKNQIRLFNMDAIQLIDLIESDKGQSGCLFYFDPPYYNKADSLYMNYYKKDDHICVSERIKNIRKNYWVLSYDDVPEINNLYNDFFKKSKSLRYSAGKNKSGNELLIFSNNLITTLSETT